MSEKIVCPICGGTLRYERVDDGYSLAEINPDGSGVLEISANSDGSTRVFCTANESHDIDTETWDKAVLLAEEAGY